MTQTIRNNKKHKQKRKTKKIKPMVCNPGVENTSINNSCFTNDVLLQLKTSFNHSHPKNKIQNSEPNKIWNDLKNKLTTCNKEDCWLETIPDIAVRNKIEKEAFAPKQPKKWKKSPKTWLTNFDIGKVLKQYEKPYPNFRIIGPTPIDFDTRPIENMGTCVWEELCNFNLQDYIDKKITKIGIVFNLDKHDESGSHWVSMFIDLEDNFIFYLDSAGDPIPTEIKTLVDKITQQSLNLSSPINLKYYDSNQVIHQMGNTECGMYSLFFIITMLTNKHNNRKFKNIKDKLNFFKNKRIPDSYIYKYRKKYFNL
jgi:hypothetical protein